MDKHNESKIRELIDEGDANWVLDILRHLDYLATNPNETNGKSHSIIMELMRMAIDNAPDDEATLLCERH
jgi:hypothetical protein